MNTNKMTIIAEALVDNREYKNVRINGEAVGVKNARKWIAAVKAIRIPAYGVRVYRYNNMGEAGEVPVCDETPVYDAIAPILEMIGEVNGAKLNARNIAEEIISVALRFRVIDITNEMAHARAEYRKARKAANEDENEETLAALEAAKAEVERLEGEPGNCKRIAEIVSEGAFVKAVEILLGDAIKKQALKSADEVAAEEEAKRAARRDAKKAKKAAKKAAKNA